MRSWSFLQCCCCWPPRARCFIRSPAKEISWHVHDDPALPCATKQAAGGRAPSRRVMAREAEQARGVRKLLRHQRGRQSPHGPVGGYRGGGGAKGRRSQCPSGGRGP